jgi:hypothetical protein
VSLRRDIATTQQIFITDEFLVAIRNMFVLRSSRKATTIQPKGIYIPSRGRKSTMNGQSRLPIKLTVIAAVCRFVGLDGGCQQEADVGLIVYVNTFRITGEHE